MFTPNEIVSMASNKVLVFDMDGTIANLYAVENWLEKLRKEDTSPYKEAEPIFDRDLIRILQALRMRYNYRVVITSWTAMNGSADYNIKVARAKRSWLRKQHFPADDIHVVKYGTEKSSVTKKLGGFQILIDDNADVRNNWTNGATIDATDFEKVYDILSAILEAEER